MIYYIIMRKEVEQDHRDNYRISMMHWMIVN